MHFWHILQIAVEKNMYLLHLLRTTKRFQWRFKENNCESVERANQKIPKSEFSEFRNSETFSFRYIADIHHSKNMETNDGERKSVRNRERGRERCEEQDRNYKITVLSSKCY